MLVLAPRATSSAYVAEASSLRQPGESPQLRVLLIGDAGGLDHASPLIALAEERAQLAPERTLVVFLGDNIYPAGLPPLGAPDRARAEARLRRQFSGLKKLGAELLFLPGNHDWANSGPDGADAVRRQQAFLLARGVEFQPRDALPGPLCRDYPGLRLLALDTQWWLHGGPKPAADEARVWEAIQACVRDAPTPVLLTTHHPPRSYGAHGGRFTWTDHLLPLRRRKGFLGLLPTPLLGSAYVGLRSLRPSAQDQAHPRYQELLSGLGAALAQHPPRLWAAGHEHNLLLDRGGSSASWLLVSGSGSSATATTHGADTLFAQSARGLAELEVFGPRWTLTIHALADGKRTLWSHPLTAPSAQ